MQDPYQSAHPGVPLPERGIGGNGTLRSYPPPPGDGNQWQELLDVLYRGKWIIMAAFVVVVGGVAAYTFTVAPEYESYSLVRIDAGDAGGLEEALGLFGGGDSYWGTTRDLATEIIVLQQSLPVAERVADQLMAMKTIPETGEPLTILYDNEGQPLPRELVAERLQNKFIRVNPEGRDVDVVRVMATSTSPGEAALLANMYTQEIQRRTQESSRARFSASRSFLEQQERDLANSLRNLEGEVEDYMSQEGAVALDEEANHTVSQIAQLEAMRDEARIELQMKTATLRSLESSLAEIQPRLIDRVASSKQVEITQAQQRLAELELLREQFYLRNPELEQNPSVNPELSRTLTEIQQLRDRIRQLSREYVEEAFALGGIDPSSDEAGLSRVAALQQQIVEERIIISGLDAKAEVLDRRLRDYNVRLRDIPQQAIQLAQLQRAQQSTERMYLFIVQKLQEASIAEESELGYVELIRKALVPRQPVRPDKFRNLLFAVIFGIMLGVGLAVAKVRLDKRIYRPEDLKAKGYSILGVIPNMEDLIKKDFSGQQTVELNGRQITTRLVSLLAPFAPIVEAYRQVRTNIQFSRPDTVIQTLLVTSSGAGEGKTVTSANIAAVMAQSGRRTLLIDADLRRPRIHKVFGLEREPGLVELIFENQPIRFAPFATDIDNLFVLPAGTSIPNPSELLGSRKMRDLLQQMRQEFDIIIFDTPPVMVATDPVLLATQADASIVVVSAGKVEEHELEQTMEALGHVGATIIGCVLNGFDASMAHGYKYKYKYYKYGYGYKYKNYYTSTTD